MIDRSLEDSTNAMEEQVIRSALANGSAERSEANPLSNGTTLGKRAVEGQKENVSGQAGKYPFKGPVKPIKQGI